MTHGIRHNEDDSWTFLAAAALDGNDDQLVQTLPAETSAPDLRAAAQAFFLNDFAAAFNNVTGYPVDNLVAALTDTWPDFG